MNKEIEEKKKKSPFTFVKEHKKEITIGTLAIGVSFVAGIVIYKKCKSPFSEAIIYSDNVHLGTETVKESISNSLSDIELDMNCDIDLSNVKIIDVESYIRKLPINYKHSKEAVEAARLLGIELADNQTFVNRYQYPRRVA